MLFLAYFLPITIFALLVYNFIITVFFISQKERFTRKKQLLRLQQVMLFLVLIGFVIYVIVEKELSNLITPTILIIPWIWGFLVSHLYITFQARWLNELLGFGVLLAITIILFFKQSAIVETHISKEELMIVYGIYLIAGLVLGSIFWPKSKEH